MPEISKTDEAELSGALRVNIHLNNDSDSPQKDLPASTLAIQGEQPVGESAMGHDNKPLQSEHSQTQRFQGKIGLGHIPTVLAALGLWWLILSVFPIGLW